MASKRKAKPAKEMPSPAAAFLPRTNRREHLAFVDGELLWLPAAVEDGAPAPPALPGKFAVILAGREVRDLGLEDADYAVVFGGGLIGEPGPAPRRARITWSRKTAGRWRRCGGHDWHAIPAKGWPGLLLRGLPDFPAIGPDARPRRVAWWIRRPGRLVRVRSAAAAPLKLRVATVYHFCPAPGCLVRLEIVDLSNVPGWPAVAERLKFPTGWNLAGKLASIRTRLDGIEAGCSADAADVRRMWVAGARPCVEFLTAALAAENPDAERMVRAALHLGECLARLDLSPRIPMIRHGKVMREHERHGRPKESPLLRAAVEQFVTENPGIPAVKLLGKLKRGGGKALGIRWAGGRFHHRDDSFKEWQGGTMLKEISKALTD